MSVLKYWDGTEWKVLGTPAKSSTSYFSIENGILTIKQEDSDSDNEDTQE